KSCKDYCTAFWRQDIYQDARVENPVINTVFKNSLKGMGSDISWNGYEHNVLFMNEGNGSYRNVAFLMGVSHESDCRSVVSGDLDNDGRPDLLVVEGRKRGNDMQREGYIQIIRNRLKTGNHWVGVHLEGQPIGAVVSVVQGEKRQFLPIVTGDSLDAQHPTTAHFGLGKTDSIDVLQVRWPDGNITRLEKPAVDNYYVIKP
ncbi:MAG: CRTAC1 family protein, partial [Pedosphaera sp.]|nr:CRTAC1 family protein [Pedosphaera sp.]